MREMKKLRGWRLSVKVRPKLIGGNVAGRLPEDGSKRAGVDLAVYGDRQGLAGAVTQHAAELRVASTLRDERETKALENRGDLSAGKALRLWHRRCYRARSWQ